MGSKGGRKGAGFLIKAKYKDKINEIKGIDDRIAVLNIEMEKS